MNKKKGLIIDWHCRKCGEEALAMVGGAIPYYICQSCGTKFEKEVIEGYGFRLVNGGLQEKTSLYHTSPMRIEQTDIFIAKKIHYPSCWDVMAYPTLASALWEMIIMEGNPICPMCGKEQDVGCNHFAEDEKRYSEGQ